METPTKPSQYPELGADKADAPNPAAPSLKQELKLELLTLKTEALALLAKLEHVFGALDGATHPATAQVAAAKEQASRVHALVKTEAPSTGTGGTTAAPSPTPTTGAAAASSPAPSPASSSEPASSPSSASPTPTPAPSPETSAEPAPSPS